MSLDGTKVRANYGTLTYTPDGGDDLDIGFTDAGIKLKMKFTNQPIIPEELGNMPLDFLNLGGPIICIGTAWQWDAATINALAEYAVSGSNLVFTNANIGRKMGAINFGALTFVPAITGHLGWTAPRAVPLLNEDSPFEIAFRKREIVTFPFAFAILPPEDGSDDPIITFAETS